MNIQGTFAFILALSVLVFVHELGHFLVAKWAGVRVETFSLFFGRPLFSVRRAKGKGWQFRSLFWKWGLPDDAFTGDETEYAVRWIPFGGYVKMSGQSDFGDAEDSGAPWEFTSKPVGARAAVIFAGPLMNFILAVIVFTWLNMTYGVVGRIGITPAPHMWVSAVKPGSRADSLGVPVGARWVSLNDSPLTSWKNVAQLLEKSTRPVIALQTPAGDTLRVSMQKNLADLHDFGVEWENGAVVGGVVPIEPANEAGMREGDTVRAVNGQPVASWAEMSRTIRRNAGRETIIEVKRDAITTVLTVTPSVDIGVDIPEGGVRLSFVPAVRTAFVQTWVVTVKIVKFIERLVTRAISPTYIAGPLGIFQMTGIAAQQGLGTYLMLVGTLSANLGFINLLPLAVLDGGLLVFLAFEAITKRRPSAKQQGYIQRIGMALLIALMILVTIMDIQRIF